MHEHRLFSPWLGKAGVNPHGRKDTQTMLVARRKDPPVAWKCAPEYLRGPTVQTPFTEGLTLENIYAVLGGLPSGAKLYLKIEGFNVAGSIKLKPALKIIRALEKSGRLCPGGTFIESSSGNFGVALSIVAKMRGYRFICVIDPNCTPAARKLMEDHGAQVICVNQRDAQGGYLGTRLALIAKMLKDDPEGLLWVNQYANADNCVHILN